jgi:hypothetical protein
MRHQRPAVLTAAIAICVVNSLGNIATLASPVPRPVAYTSLVLAPIGVIGAIGLWRLMRWGALLSTGVLALTALLAAPGIVVAPILIWHAFAAVIMILDFAGIALIVVPSSRRAYGFLLRSTPSAESTVLTR